MSDYPKITYKKHTFLSSLAMGLSALAITIIISCTVLIIYGIHFASQRPEALISLARKTIAALPELQEGLPPVLSDVLDHRREPEYAQQLDITAETKFVPHEHNDHSKMVRTRIEIVNNGSEVVCLLGLRVVVFAASGEILSESNEWAATPVAADHEWRGPLMPGSHRYFVSSKRALGAFFAEGLETKVEITHLRVWNGREDGPLIEDDALSQTRISEPAGEIQTFKEY